jgi:GT2 family glycosyltransferase
MKKLLIYVPTYNGGKRLEYFVKRFIKVSGGFDDYVYLHISDNCNDIFSPPVGIENIKYSINSKNIGLSRNFNKVYSVNSSSLQNPCNPHECWLSGVNPDGQNSQIDIQWSLFSGSF